jgi:chromosomal replication initiation ATPase DnaA
MSKEKEGGQGNDNENQADQKNSQTWNLVREKLSEYISGDAFSRWFKNAELVDPEQQDGLVAVQSDMHQIWIETNYMDELRAAFAEGAGIHCSPQIVVKGDVGADLSRSGCRKDPIAARKSKDCSAWCSSKQFGEGRDSKFGGENPSFSKKAKTSRHQSRF